MSPGWGTEPFLPFFATRHRLPSQPSQGRRAEPQPCWDLLSPVVRGGGVTASVTNCLPKFLTKTPIRAIYSTGSNLWRPVLRSVIKH